VLEHSQLHSKIGSDRRWLVNRGILSYVMIVLISLVGLVNFFAPFFYPAYRPDPVVTYIFMGTASAIAGFKGLGLALFKGGNSTNNDPGAVKERE
jgi:hypothetical protein